MADGIVPGPARNPVEPLRGSSEILAAAYPLSEEIPVRLDADDGLGNGAEHERGTGNLVHSTKVIPCVFCNA